MVVIDNARNAVSTTRVKERTVGAGLTAGHQPIAGSARTCA
jgi:hypothetical protein